MARVPLISYCFGSTQACKLPGNSLRLPAVGTCFRHCCIDSLRHQKKHQTNIAKQSRNENKHNTMISAAPQDASKWRHKCEEAYCTLRSNILYFNDTLQHYIVRCDRRVADSCDNNWEIDGFDP